MRSHNVHQNYMNFLCAGPLLEIQDWVVFCHLRDGFRWHLEISCITRLTVRASLHYLWNPQSHECSVFRLFILNFHYYVLLVSRFQWLKISVKESLGFLLNTEIDGKLWMVCRFCNNSFSSFIAGYFNIAFLLFLVICESI